MRDITVSMCKEFRVYDLGFDFAGYTFDKKQSLSFHHLIIPRRECRKLRVPKEGYVRENGAILKQDSSHDYFHKIELVDRDVFLALTDEMIMENIEGKISLERLRKISDILHYFEREHCGDRFKNGRQLIKPEYVRNRIKI